MPSCLELNDCGLISTTGGQCGHHHSSDHRRHSVTSWRRRLVWPGTLVLVFTALTASVPRFFFVPSALDRWCRGAINLPVTPRCDQSRSHPRPGPARFMASPPPTPPLPPSQEARVVANGGIEHDVAASVNVVGGGFRTNWSEAVRTAIGKGTTGLSVTARPAGRFVRARRTTERSTKTNALTVTWPPFILARNVT